MNAASPSAREVADRILGSFDCLRRETAKCPDHDRPLLPSLLGLAGVNHSDPAFVQVTPADGMLRLIRRMAANWLPKG
jgi:hypothetical protein